MSIASKRRDILRAIALSSTAAALSGCGFALRGSTPLPANLMRFHLQTSLELSRELEILLASNDRIVTDDAPSADATIKTASERFQRRVLSVNPETGKEREVELAYSVNFTVLDGAGETLIASQRLRLLRDFIFDSEEILGKSREQDVLREEMRADAAQQIMWRLSSISETHGT